MNEGKSKKKRKMSETKAKDMKGKHNIREKLKEDGKSSDKIYFALFS